MPGRGANFHTGALWTPFHIFEINNPFFFFRKRATKKASVILELEATAEQI